VSAEIEVTDEGAVRVLTINRPARRNALSVATADLLRSELDRAEADPAVGAIVLTGAGGHFSAGGDAEAILAVTEEVDEGDDAAPTRLMRAFHRLVETVWHSPLPVVAAVSGVAYGGAFNLALACDLVVCSADARFCQVFLRRGVVPDVGGAYLLPRLIGMQRAKELMLLAGEIDAVRAEELGLVNAIRADPDATRAYALELAGRLAAGPRFAIAQTKKLINGSTAGTLQSSLELEAAVQAGVLVSPTARRGFRSFLTKTDHG
jgi:2-(1,2-epoxy-1,2-dihydrophenyl)acetyl-CoA isomerase